MAILNDNTTVGDINVYDKLAELSADKANGTLINASDIDNITETGVYYVEGMINEDNEDEILLIVVRGNTRIAQYTFSNDDTIRYRTKTITGNWASGWGMIHDPHAAPIKHASTSETYGLASATTFGHVRLSDNTTSNANVTAGIAATPSAVKAAYDLASGKAPTSHASTATTYGTGNSTLYGHVKLSDSTSSTKGINNGTAATPNAVKKVQDSVDDLTGNIDDLEYGLKQSSKKPVKDYYFPLLTSVFSVNDGAWVNSVDNGCAISLPGTTKLLYKGEIYSKSSTSTWMSSVNDGNFVILITLNHINKTYTPSLINLIDISSNNIEKYLDYIYQEYILNGTNTAQSIVLPYMFISVAPEESSGFSSPLSYFYLTDIYGIDTSQIKCGCIEYSSFSCSLDLVFLSDASNSTNAGYNWNALYNFFQCINEHNYLKEDTTVFGSYFHFGNNVDRNQCFVFYNLISIYASTSNTFGSYNTNYIGSSDNINDNRASAGLKILNGSSKITFNGMRYYNFRCDGGSIPHTINVCTDGIMDSCYISSSSPNDTINLISLGTRASLTNSQVSSQNYCHNGAGTLSNTAITMGQFSSISNCFLDCIDVKTSNECLIIGNIGYNNSGTGRLSVYIPNTTINTMVVNNIHCQVSNLASSSTNLVKDNIT